MYLKFGEYFYFSWVLEDCEGIVFLFGLDGLFERFVFYKEVNFLF